MVENNVPGFQKEVTPQNTDQQRNRLIDKEWEVYRKRRQLGNWERTLYTPSQVLGKCLKEKAACCTVTREDVKVVEDVNKQLAKKVECFATASALFIKETPSPQSEGSHDWKLRLRSRRVLLKTFLLRPGNLGKV